MADKYDFGNLSPIEFEALCVDLVSAETGHRFESFSEGSDQGIDGRFSRSDELQILQAKHYKNSTWSDLKKASKAEHFNVVALNPNRYFFLTSQLLTPSKKSTLIKHLNHQSVSSGDIWGRSELNALISKHGDVEKRNIKLWLSNAAVLERLLCNDIAVFNTGNEEELARLLKVFVPNPSLSRAASILTSEHCVVISGPPGVGKTTLAQILAAEYCDDGWEVTSVSSIDQAFEAFHDNKKQVFMFDDFLGRIKLNEMELANNDGKLARFIRMVKKRSNKRFVLTTRAYILENAKLISEHIDDDQIKLSQLMLDLSNYDREIKSKILYNHLYHSGIDREYVSELLSSGAVRKIIDHPNYMPRIIEWMTDPIKARMVPPTEYARSFIGNLNEPHKIWEKAFRKHISLKARVLLYCMFFVPPHPWPTPGVRLSDLKNFFFDAAKAFLIAEEELLTERGFEEGVAELNSSFITINSGKANFINPSVQDFLSRETRDKKVVEAVAVSIADYDMGESIWSKVKSHFGRDEEFRRRVAATLMCRVKSEEFRGVANILKLINIVGDWMFETNDFAILSEIKNKKLSHRFYIAESDVAEVIGVLSNQKYNTIPYKEVFVRYLRIVLFKWLKDPEYTLSIDDVGALARDLQECRVEFSEGFWRLFEGHAEFAVDELDEGSVHKHDSVETTLESWIDQINDIQWFVNNSEIEDKKERFTSILMEFQSMREADEDEWRMQQSLSRANASGEAFSQANVSSANSGPIDSFSSDDIDSMFASLKE